MTTDNITDNIHHYPAPVWSRFLAPDRAGPLHGMQEGTRVFTARAGTPAARAVLQLSVRLRGTGVEACRFLAYGCPVSIAVGQWLAEQLESGVAGPPSAAQIRRALEIPEQKAHCALMGEDAVAALWTQIR